MERWIALLLVMSMLVTMLPPALAEAVVEIPEIPDGDIMIVESEDAEASPLELTEVEINDIPIEDFGESEEAEALGESSDEPESEGEEAVDAEETTSTEAVEGTNAKQGKVPASLQLGVKEKYTLNTKGLARGAKITFKSSKPAVAKVSAKGVITGVKAGSATVTCYNGKKKLATCKVKVVKAPTKVSFAAKTLTLGVKETLTLTPTVPKGSHASYTWTVKNKKIATVTKDGKLTGVKKGKTTVTVKTHNGKKATLKVIVMKAPTKVTVKPKTLSLEAGKSSTLKATLPKKTASNKLTWTTSNKKVATVDENGTVTGVKAGKATITVKTFNGMKNTCAVTVTAPEKKEQEYRQEKLEKLSEKGVEDPDALSFIREINGNITDINKSISSYNKKVASAEKERKEITESVLSASVNENANEMSLSWEDASLKLDSELMQKLADGAKVEILDTTDDAVVMSIGGIKCSAILSGDTVRITVNSVSSNAGANAVSNALNDKDYEKSRSSLPMWVRSRL